MTTATKRPDPMTSHVHDAGFTEKAYGRASAHAEQWVNNRARKEAARNPVSSVWTSKDGCDPILPKEFLAEAIAKIEVHVGRGHWEQAKATIDAIFEEWQLRQQEQSGLAALPLGERLASHITRLGLEIRTVNMIDSVCFGTVGALLEAFPAAFIGQPNCGIVTVRKIAEALLRARLIDEAEAQRQIDEWERGTDLAGRTHAPIHGYEPKTNQRQGRESRHVAPAGG